MSPLRQQSSRSGLSSAARAEELSRLFETVHEGVYIGTRAGATIVANPYLKAILGYPADTRDEEVRLFDEDRFIEPSARTAFFEHLTGHGAVADHLLRLRRADGTPLWIEITARLAAAGPDGSARIEALVRDVTDRRRHEDQAKDLYQQILQTEKLAALGQTISGVAHELNNPLATILTWAERLSQRPVDEVTGRGVETILHEAERSARIVRNLLTFARKRQTTRALVDLDRIVRETLALRAYELRVNNITMVDAIASGIPQVFADSHQIQQVLLNLVINAEQAMLVAHGRGTLVVRTWHDAERDVVVLEISDDGPGVPKEIEAKIFDPFFTTKEVGKGTGLGLTVAYAIVQEHGGRLWHRSSPAEGTSFFVELPSASPPARPTPVPAQTAAAKPPANASILVVEDEPALAAAVADALREAGFAVDRAGDGEEALRRARRRHYDLVVCDLRMPRLDGTEFYRAIAASAPALARRVIFVTGDVAGTDAERFLEESGCRWLAKPFRLADLLRTCREALA